MTEGDSTLELCTINEIDPEAVAFVQGKALPDRTVERLNSCIRVSREGPDSPEIVRRAKLKYIY